MPKNKFVVAPSLRMRWADGALQLRLERGGPVLSTGDASVVQLLHAFAKPADPAAVAREVAGNPAELARAIADFTRAGFLVPVAEEAPAPAVEEGPAPTASVIIPTYEKPAYLDLTLASFLGQTHTDHEIIVIADGGSGAERAIVEKYQAQLPLRYLRCEHQGRARTRNAGLEVARGKIVIFNDDDCLAGPDFVAAHVEAHAARSQPTVVLGWVDAVVSLLDHKLMGPLFPALHRKMGGDAGTAIALLSADELRARFHDAVAQYAMAEPDFQRKVAPAVASYGEDLADLELGWFLGATNNLSAPLALIREVGCFDPAYQTYGMEDTDLCYSLWCAGARCIVNRKAINYHQVHSRADVGGEMSTTLGYFCRKHSNLDALLFAHWFFGRIDLPTADAIAKRARAVPDDPVVAVLFATMRETLASRLAR